MMLLAFVDVHGDGRCLRILRKKAKKADLILCAGDITVFENHMRMILRELNSFKKPILIIPGNHEPDSRLRKACEKFKNITYFHKKLYEKDDVVIAGFGGDGFSLRDKKFEAFARKIKPKIKNKKFILMLHGPPYGNKTDLIQGEHAGNKSYRDFIVKQKPVLVICGHLHENEGVKDKIGKSIILNPGPDGRLIEI